MSTQHDRRRSHSGTDLDTNIVLSAAVGSISAGSTLATALARLAGIISVADRETVLADFGSGLEVVTDADDDWLYGIFGASTDTVFRREVALADFGSGLEPATDDTDDWLYARYAGV